MKEDFFSKFKDYNRELEKILEHKDFSKDVKNLLLSMFYKLEISYNDYFLVKGNCKTKQEYLENILDNIKIISSIELVQPNDNKFDKIKESGQYEIDLKMKKIKVLPNEFAILSAILELNNFQIYLREEYNLIRNSMPYVLNMAYDMENLEVLRDFNAWSWNTAVNEIKDININLIYQNLKIALDTNVFDKIMKEDADVIIKIKEILFSLYDEEEIEKFLKIIFKVSIIKYINVSQNEKKRLLEERETLEKDLNEIKDKKLYTENISKIKKGLTSELKKIDLIINNKELLLEEYEKRNSVLSEYNKIFSLSHLVEKLQKEREKILSKIDICNKKVEPKNYLKDKNKLQEDYNLLKDINFEGDNNIYKYIDKIQSIFIDYIFMHKIDKSYTRQELIKCMYELRYYNFLPYESERLIKDVIKFKKQLEKAEEFLIKKLYSAKIINNFSTSEKNDIEIVKNIFDLKIINMEYIYIEINKNDEKYIIKTYDEKETLEKEFEVNLEFNKKDKIKLNKKIKLFN